MQLKKSILDVMVDNIINIKVTKALERPHSDDDVKLIFPFVIKLEIIWLH